MAGDIVVSLKDARIVLGAEPLAERADIVLERGVAAGLIGPNGSGKSTLMKALAGLRELDGGERAQIPGAVIAMMEQEPDLSRYESAAAYALDGLEPEQAHRAYAELDKMGLDPEASPGAMSGGEKRRAALAKCFARAPDALLLDEPTNHLDIEGVEALEARLQSYRGAALIISHDRRFLENVTQRCFWLRHGEALRMDKGFAHFDAWRDETEAAEEREAERLDTKLKAEARWLARGVTARRKRNMGRLRKLHEMRAERRTLAQRGRGDAAVALETAAASGKKVLEITGLTKSFGDTVICENFNLRVVRGERIGIAGPNGAGKSSLVKLIMGELEPDRGSVTMGSGLTVAYLDQTREQLRPGASLWDHLAPKGGDQIMVRGRPKHIAAYAKEFLFCEGQLRQPVEALSGGERNRLMLAIALAQPVNMLVLDEPTNDLDLETLELLVEALDEFDGTLLVVSHDRDFLDRVATSMIVVEGGGRIVQVIGGWSDYERERAAARAASRAEPAAKTPPATKPRQEAPAPAKKSLKLSYKDQRRLEELEAGLPRWEEEAAGLETKLADPGLYTRDAAAFERLTNELAAVRARIEHGEAEWLDLEAKREALGSG